MQKIKRHLCKESEKTNKKVKREYKHLFLRFLPNFSKCCGGSADFPPSGSGPAQESGPGHFPLQFATAASRQNGVRPLRSADRKSLPAAAFCAAKHVYFWCTFLCGSFICFHEESNPVTRTHSAARIHFTFQFGMATKSMFLSYSSSIRERRQESKTKSEANKRYGYLMFHVYRFLLQWRVPYRVHTDRNKKELSLPTYIV